MTQDPANRIFLIGRSGCCLLAGLGALLICARRGKLHPLATREERVTQDQGSRVQQARQQGAVRPMEDSNT